MANRYWVGGTASWDGTAGTKWALTSGGVGGQAVPTSADDVFFDGNSGANTVTIATGNTGARIVNCTGFTGTLTGSATLNVTGSLTLVAGMTYSFTGVLTLSGTGTLTTAGKTLNHNVIINGSGITVTLGDALTLASTRSLDLLRGVFDTANYSVTAPKIISSSSAFTRQLTLGSSTVTLSDDNQPFDLFSATNLTVNAGTSQINVTGTLLPVFQNYGQTLYNVSFTNLTFGLGAFYGGGTVNNLTVTAAVTTGITQLAFNTGITVNGTLTCAGSSALTRCFITGATGSVTITAVALSANDCDFRDVTIAGLAAGTAPTRAGDCGGNSGITFPAAKTVYRVGTNTTWAGSSSWATTTGGAGADTNFPLAQDTAVINNDTTLTGTLTLSGGYNAGTLNCSARTTGITLSHTSGFYWHGSYTLSSGITISGGITQYFYKRGGNTDFTSAGKTITFPISVNTIGGTFKFLDAYNSSNTITLTNGTLDANNYNVTCTRFDSTSGTRTLTMGSGLWTLSGTASIWNINTGLTFNKGTANILASNTSTSARTFTGGSKAYNKLTIGGATGTSTFTISNTNSFTELASTKTVAHTITFSANQGTIDTWSITGSPGNVVTVNSSVVGTQRTFALTNVTSGINYLSVKDIGVTTVDKFLVGINSTDGGNNTNVYFIGGGGTGNMFMLLW